MKTRSDNESYLWTARAAYLIIFGLALAAGVFAWGREYLGFGTETDFGGFVVQAQTILDGHRIALFFHPPLYGATLAVLKNISGNWFAAGLWLSWVSCLAVLASQYHFFSLTLGREAGVGALLALATSVTFVSFSAMATTDLFFLALWSTALWYTAWALTISSRPLWGASGFVSGLTILARTNGLVVLGLAALPWISKQSCSTQSSRSSATAAWALGLSVPILVWITVAVSTGSDVWPTKTYANLGMSFFGPGDRITGESRIAAEQQFNGLLDVLTHEPLTMVSKYVTDLLVLPKRLVNSHVVAGPVAVLALLGLPFSVRRLLSRKLLGFVLVSAFHGSIVNFMTYQPRFYLFVVPWVGAFAAVGIISAADRLGRRTKRVGGLLALGCAILYSTFVTLPASYAAVHRDDAELGWLVATTRSSLPPGAAVVVRKHQLRFHSDVITHGFPNVGSVEDLRKALAGIPDDPVYVYFGTHERRTRPGLQELADPSNAPDWLEPVAVMRSESWVLYRVTHSSPGNPPGSP